jgi:type IV secretion system protein VirB10
VSGNTPGRPEYDRDIDNHLSAVSGQRQQGLTTLQKVGVAGLLLLIFLSFIWLEQVGRGHSGKSQSQASALPTQGQPLEMAPDLPGTSTAALPMPSTSPLPGSLLGFRQPSQQETAANSPIMAFSGGLSAAAQASPVGQAAVRSTSSPADEYAARPTALTARLRPTIVEPTKATLLPHPDFLITEGTIIPCTLQTAINSELAGYVRCVIPQDIRGTTGNVVLLDKGTQITGEILSGLVQGQDRLFVLWDRAETPDHAVVTLDSPGSDALGRAGVPGAVNNHFWQRFGSAILLSVIQGGLQAGSALAANSGSGGSSNSLFLNSFSNNGTALSNSALEASINIPPTLEKNQGDNVAIFVNRDLDFSDIYSLRVTGDD